MLYYIQKLISPFQRDLRTVRDFAMKVFSCAFEDMTEDEIHQRIRKRAERIKEGDDETNWREGTRLVAHEALDKVTRRLKE